MQLQLDQARHGPLRWHESIPSGTLESRGDRRDRELVRGAVDCEGSLVFTGPDFLLQARLRYRRRLDCDRCLAGFEEDVDLALAFVVAAASRDAPGAPGPEDEAAARELEAEDLSILVAADGAVDLVPLVGEQIDLNVPMKPICDPGCRGLCPLCGADRNRDACDCRQERTDPRWAGLEAMRARLTGDSGGNC